MSEPLHNQWMPDEKEIHQVEALAAAGLNEEHIADYLMIGRTTFQMAQKKNTALRQALLHGRANAIANVAKTAYSMAIRGDNPSMTQFYLKCRAGWKYVTVVEHEGLKESEEKKVSELLTEFKDILAAAKGE